MVRLEDSGTHLDESALLRVIDEDGAAEELALFHAHLLTCDGCTSRMDLLERRSVRVSEMLDELQLPPDFKHPVPVSPFPASTRAGVRSPRGFRTDWIRAAAVIVLLLAPLLAIQPLRAAVGEWLSARWTEVAALVGGGSAPERRADDAGATLWFAPAGPELRVEVAARQTGGALIIRISPTDEGSLQVVNGNGNEMPMISDRRIQILNTPQSVASYELGVPSGVRTVIVRVGQDPPIAVPRGEIGAGRIVSLSASGAR